MKTVGKMNVCRPGEIFAAKRLKDNRIWVDDEPAAHDDFGRQRADQIWRSSRIFYMHSISHEKYNFGKLVPPCEWIWVRCYLTSLLRSDNDIIYIYIIIVVGSNMLPPKWDFFFKKRNFLIFFLKPISSRLFGVRKNNI